MVAEWDDTWHPARGPRTVPLTLCDECGKFVENLVDHYDREHLSEAEEALREAKRARERERAWRRRRRPAG